MNNKVLVGGLIGGITTFLLSYLVYGLALGSTLEANMMTGINRPMAEMNWAFLILGNLFTGILYAWVLDKANANSLSAGATTGAILALLLGLGLGFTWYGISNIYTGLTGVLIDLVGGVIIGAVVGAVIGWWYSRGRTAVVG
ncbi:MAG TPA: hypothetical protein VMZ69_05410 [Saprospiraceae bacterium]|nr:hypothetical protein [Saprospiraceae bacterium]